MDSGDPLFGGITRGWPPVPVVAVAGSFLEAASGGGPCAVAPRRLRMLVEDRPGTRFGEASPVRPQEFPDRGARPGLQANA